MIDNITKFFTETVVTQWDLVCEKSLQSSLISSISLCGLLIGALVFGYLGDIIGRRNALILSSCGALIFELLTAFVSFNLIMFTVFRFMTGAFIHGSIPIGVVYALEYVDSKYRSWASAIGTVIHLNFILILMRREITEKFPFKIVV